jgi:hypothetical protein
VKPGVIPEDFPRTTFQGFTGPAEVLGPRTISSRDRSRTPIRFVNHVESGTSPRVLTFMAGGASPFGRWRKVRSITS